ncbi:MAG: hypothetical protein QM638_14315 [Nocardioides sp.]|uniref:hypothetical protein n=1 Tax=Nocardioides sp. TaxID=35761 RepID=UPI0039E44495
MPMLAWLPAEADVLVLVDREWTELQALRPSSAAVPVTPPRSERREMGTAGSPIKGTFGNETDCATLPGRLVAGEAKLWHFEPIPSIVRDRLIIFACFSRDLLK